MTLRKYREKRHFDKTAEPPGRDDVVVAGGAARFVVQKHDARRLHYDFRLEIDGVLKSWAIPKGPSLDPKHRRLAVEVEDHPIDYGDFEGTIPEGEYGAGPVMVWDRGTFVVDGDALAAWHAGRMSFTLNGEKLRGRFRLIRMPRRENEKQNAWLLMHGRDEHAVDDADVDHLPATSAKSRRTLEQIAQATDSVWHSKPTEEPATTKKKARMKKAKAADVVVAGVRITSPDRLVFHDSELTKRDVARYFEATAPLMLPHVRRRPLSVVRCPNGSRGACFFQKHVTKGMPAGIHSFDVNDDGEQWLMIDDVDGLVGLAQMGTLEIHPWGSVPDDPEHPGRIVMDLDPAEGVPWPQVAAGARIVRARLQASGLRSFLLSTGGKGLHVIAPLDGRAGWEQVRTFTRDIATALEREQPELYTANLRKAARTGRVFVDHLRNGRGSTAIAPFSTRARPGAPVAVPLDWSELDDAVAVAVTMLTLQPRLQRPDPWADFFAVKQGLRAVTEAHAPGA
ncbi:MAG: non-homologous end-joining DNA ligase [Deltaproteobacteria bacterium]|nr:non-homologous end-joining DNA ligase [Deltaproteobacteria bacterium]